MQPSYVNDVNYRGARTPGRKKNKIPHADILNTSKGEKVAQEEQAGPPSSSLQISLEGLTG
jgi:hypothetical protein